jgi:hypothetical protein
MIGYRPQGGLVSTEVDVDPNRPVEAMLTQ